MTNVERLLAVIDAEDDVDRFAVADALEEEGRDAEAAWFRAGAAGGGPFLQPRPMMGAFWWAGDGRHSRDDPSNRNHPGSVIPDETFRRLPPASYGDGTLGVKGYHTRAAAFAALMRALGLSARAR